MSRGELFVLSAPSGTGKTTLIRGLMGGELADLFDVHFSISHTTRGPRSSEVDGRDYHFVDVPTFQGMIHEEQFLEWADVHGNYYGTSFAEVVPYVERGVDVLMDIDVQGAERVLTRYRRLGSDRETVPTGVHSIFIMPPTYADLERRLRQRNLDGEQQIARRLADSRAEIERVDLYDYAIVNKDAGAASRILAAIILEKRFRRERMRAQVDEVLRDFREFQPAPKLAD